MTEPPEVITKVEEVYILPPASTLIPCAFPFSHPPLTHSESEMIERDLTWLTALSKCAKQVDDAAKWVQDKQTYK
ncbi:Rz1-like lysis system protein LysC [Vibrio hepatarius]|uniref:Rz1-like lysis system protein LysC n=1 Tax=Vibrio hepatarius TaxID=171383 RepID=UPI0016AF0EA9|nr:hypothetical protein [Vibrio hepatarius]